MAGGNNCGFGRKGVCGERWRCRYSAGGRIVTAHGRRRQMPAVAGRADHPVADRGSGHAAGRCAGAERERRARAVCRLRAAGNRRYGYRECRAAGRGPDGHGVGGGAPARLRLDRHSADGRTVFAVRPGRTLDGGGVGIGIGYGMHGVRWAEPSGLRLMARSSAGCVARGGRGRGNSEGRRLDRPLRPVHRRVCC